MLRHFPAGVALAPLPSTLAEVLHDFEAPGTADAARPCTHRTRLRGGGSDIPFRLDGDCDLYEPDQAELGRGISGRAVLFDRTQPELDERLRADQHRRKISDELRQQRAGTGHEV